MADTPSNPPAGGNTPGNDPQPAKKKRASPSPINTKYLDEIKLVRALVLQAQKLDRAAALTAAGWSSARIAALGTMADNLETAALAAVGRTRARGLDTAAEETAKKEMLAALHPIRVGAKRKYRNGDDAAAGRNTYFVNKETNVSLERLLFIAGSVLLKLTATGGGTPEDTLPGVTPAVIATLTMTRANYIHADEAQGETNSAKNQAHLDVVTQYTTTHQERLDLQLAADQIWSYHDPANRAVRGDFEIPPDRPAIE